MIIRVFHNEVRAIKKCIFLIMFLSALGHAEIYKCTDSGRISYSDSPCGSGAEIINVKDAAKPIGAKFSTEKMDALGNKLGIERHKAELDRGISRQQAKIEKLINDYVSESEKLDKELINHKRNKDSNSWSKHPYKKKQFYETKQRLSDKIRKIKQTYRIEKEKAYNKLYSLKADRRKL